MLFSVLLSDLNNPTTKIKYKYDARWVDFEQLKYLIDTYPNHEFINDDYDFPYILRVFQDSITYCFGNTTIVKYLLVHTEDIEDVFVKTCVIKTCSPDGKLDKYGCNLVIPQVGYKDFEFPRPVLIYDLLDITYDYRKLTYYDENKNNYRTVEVFKDTDKLNSVNITTYEEGKKYKMVVEHANSNISGETYTYYDFRDYTIKALTYDDIVIYECKFYYECNF